MNRFIPLTDADRSLMLEKIGIDSIEQLFADIPQKLRLTSQRNLAGGQSELELNRDMRQLASMNCSADDYVCFLGAGCYDHYIPSVVDHMLARQEFYTAYTPYQAEISQGMLQAIFEYQTMICQLTGLDASNASLYDGATALVEASLMACQATRRTDILYAGNIHPHSSEVLKTYARLNRYNLVRLPLVNGCLDLAGLEKCLSEQTAAVIIQNPNFFGMVEDIAAIADSVHHYHAYLIVSADPIALGLLEAPGSQGADIVTGDGQSLGSALNFGGPSLGFIAAAGKDMRHLPGRIVGQTLDKEGRRGYVLTMQTREQHIRREKASSNICSNQALNALAASIYLAIMGKQGLQDVARQCLDKSHYAYDKLLATGRFYPMFDGPFFKEFVVKSKEPAAKINRQLLREHIIGGLDLNAYFPEYGAGWLIAVTEKRSRAEIDLLAEKAVI